MTTTLAHPTLDRELRDLATRAPGTLGFGALAEVGLADHYAPIETPLGRAYVAWNGRGVSWISANISADEFEARFSEQVGRPIRAAAALPEPLRRAIERRMAGDRRARIDLDLRGHTPFEVAVWTKALEIPHGEVRPYAWIAAEIGRPRAVRAVGTALANNPVPLVVPCHRVVRSDGRIGEYGMGGPEAKRRILGVEGVDTATLEREAAAGVRFTGSDTTHIVCHPTCRDARRTTPRHRVGFPSLAAAAAAGYRPCRHCRPVSLGRAA